MIFLGYSDEPDLHQWYFTVGWFKLPIRAYLLNAKSAISVIILDLSDWCNNQFDMLVSVYQVRNELNVVADGDE